MYRGRGTHQSTQNMSDTEREALLMTNYIDLMTNVLTSSAQVTESFNISMRRILENCNSLFDNYYQLGQNNSDVTENLSTTRRRRNRRSRNSNTTTTNTVGNNTTTNAETDTSSTFRWTPAGSASTRSWLDIIGNSETTTANTQRSNINYFSNDITRDNTRDNTRLQWRNRRPSVRNTRQSPLSNTTTNRVIRPPGAVTRQTNLQTFINNTLHTAFRNYTLSREQINSVLTTTPWREIQGISDQTVCPITQIPFQEDEMVSRITRCGHIFSTNAINNYLLNYDNRCPVCRLNLSNISSQSTDNSFTSTTTPVATTTNERPPNTETRSTISNELNNAVNLASNAFVNELTNNLTNNLFGGENAPTQISAEYSLFLPTNTTNTTNATNTTTTPQTAFNWTFTPNTNVTPTTDVPPPSHPPPPTDPPPTPETTQSPESDASRYVTTYVEQQNPESKEEIEEPEVDADADTDVEDDGEEKIEERTRRK